MATTGSMCGARGGWTVLLLALIACALAVRASQPAHSEERRSSPPACSEEERPAGPTARSEERRVALPAHSEEERQAALQRVFEAIDVNHDSQLDEAETEQYVKASLDPQQEGWSAQAATQASRSALDGPDAGATVSPAELSAHLQALLQDHRVEEWVTHGLNLRQHAAAFRRAAITALDFPFLVADGGVTLQQELGVSSKLHQQQILRGLKRLILALGELPGAPRQLECAAANRSSLRLTWRPPARAGHPPFHKYVLQRRRLAAPGSGAAGSAAGASPTGGGASWELAGEPDDEDGAWLDLPPAKGGYQYRLAAWSAYGRSPYAASGGACSVRAVQPTRPAAPAAPLAVAEVQALLAAVAAAGNLSGAAATAAAAGTGGGGGVWSWSAASSAAVVALTVLLKASQLRVGGMLLSLWQRLTAWRRGRRGAAEAAASSSPPPPEGPAGDGAALAGGAGVAEVPSLPDGSGGLLRCHSSTQLLGTAESGGPNAGGPVWDALAAADSSDGAAVEQLQLAIQRGAHCAHPGCHRRFDRLRDVRRKLESHHCGLCQHMYCLTHTRVSPHGPRGGCGLESQCICFACFAELAPAQQAACDRASRLPKPATAAAEAAAAAAAVEATPVQSRVAAEAPPGGGPPAVDGTQETHLAAAPAAGPPWAEAVARGGGGSTQNVGHAVGGGAAARQRWKKAGAAMRALVRFKAAGSNPASPR